MTTLLMLLVRPVALTFVQMLIAASTAQMQVGIPRLLGNRDDMPKLTGLAGRAQRGHHNMLESLVLFAALVLVAHIAGKANATAVLGAQLFFWARVAYAIIYLAGIPMVRTGVWAVSVVGLVLIFLQLLG